MTEAEWFGAARPLKLLRYLHTLGDSSDRKFRLFGVVCCRRVEEQIPDRELAEVIESCEQLADEVSVDDLNLKQFMQLSRVADRSRERATRFEADCDLGYTEFAFGVSQLTEYPLHPEHCADSCMSALCGHDDYDTGQGEMLFQADILRDVFGNPFRPVVFYPEWRKDTAVAIARAMYEARDFSAMPILADALQDAGCGDDDILSHCRDEKQVHVRGCWVVDLVLGLV